MKRFAPVPNIGAASDLALAPMRPARMLRRWLAPVLARAAALGLLALIVVGPPSASPTLAAPPETGALHGYNLIRDPPRPGADAHPAAMVHGFNIVYEPPRPTGPQGQTAPGAVDGFNIFPDPPRPGADARSATMVQGFSIIYQPPRPTG